MDTEDNNKSNYTVCPNCDCKVSLAPGMVHGCIGTSYFCPTLASIDAKLAKLCELFEGSTSKANGAAAEEPKPKTMAATAGSGSKARNRETRAAQS
jgi:hypothetical protein